MPNDLLPTRCLAVLALAASFAVAGCSLNPQPLPPGEGTDNPTNAGGVAAGEGDAGDVGGGADDAGKGARGDAATPLRDGASGDAEVTSHASDAASTDAGVGDSVAPDAQVDGAI